MSHADEQSDGFETGISEEWIQDPPANYLYEQSDEQAHSGTYSMKYTFKAGQDDANAIHPYRVFEVQPGNYTARRWYYVPTGWSSTQIRATASQVYPGFAAGLTTTLDFSKRDQWQEVIQVMRFRLPGTITLATIHIGDVPDVDDVYYLDDVLIVGIAEPSEPYQGSAKLISVPDAAARRIL